MRGFGGSNGTQNYGPSRENAKEKHIGYHYQARNQQVLPDIDDMDHWVHPIQTLVQMCNIVFSALV